MPEAPGRGCELSTSEVLPGAEELPRILASVREVYGRDSRTIEQDIEAGRSRLHAIHEDGRFAGYLLLANYLDPLQHVGNQMDARVVRRFLEDPRRRVWAITLLHGEPGTRHELADLPEALLRAAGAAGGGEDPTFLVTLGRSGDPRSWRLFRQLGFREEGAASWLAEVDLSCEKVPLSPQAMPSVAWFSDGAPLPALELAGAYNDVFGQGTAILSARDVQAIASSPSFFPEISGFFLESGTVTGFLLASRRSGAGHIDCLGIRLGRRGRGYLERCFGLWKARARAAGIARCTFVTGRREVCRYAERRFGARVMDELVWLARGGAARRAQAASPGRSSSEPRGQ